MAFAIVGVAYFTYKSQGWSEKYFFTPSVTSLSDALPKMQQIVWGRSALYGDGVECTFARVSSTNPVHDGRACELPYPIGPHPSWSRNGSGLPGDQLGPPNDPDTCMQMRFETAIGNYWQRYYRCMPDFWVLNSINQYKQYWQALPAGAAIGDMSPTGGLSHLQVCQTFWSYLIANTAYAKLTSPNNYTLGTINSVVFRKVTDKAIGRPFGTSRGRRQKTLIS
jgi:hypothetical protein